MEGSVGPAVHGCPEGAPQGDGEFDRSRQVSTGQSLGSHHDWSVEKWWGAGLHLAPALSRIPRTMTLTSKPFGQTKLNTTSETSHKLLGLGLEGRGQVQFEESQAEGAVAMGGCLRRRMVWTPLMPGVVALRTLLKRERERDAG
eukprot:555267-Rhodomonas_salina.1